MRSRQSRNSHMIRHHMLTRNTSRTSHSTRRSQRSHHHRSRLRQHNSNTTRRNIRLLPRPPNNTRITTSRIKRPISMTSRPQLIRPRLNSTNISRILLIRDNTLTRIIRKIRHRVRRHMRRRTRRRRSTRYSRRTAHRRTGRESSRLSSNNNPRI